MLEFNSRAYIPYADSFYHPERRPEFSLPRCAFHSAREDLSRAATALLSSSVVDGPRLFPRPISSLGRCGAWRVATLPRLVGCDCARVVPRRSGLAAVVVASD